uniref:Uncharacterized protein n=1 Tax=Anguilla anguilla TaxID=7936 RepID=A0A0E9TUR4_ANGAN
MYTCLRTTPEVSSQVI